MSIKKLKLKEKIFNLPVLSVHVNYDAPHDCNDSRRVPRGNKKIQVYFNKKIGYCHVEDAAKFYLENQGLKVLGGAEVNTFIRFFLLQSPSKSEIIARRFNTPDDNDLLKPLQNKQRLLLKRYFSRKIKFDEVIKGALTDATNYYFPPKNEKLDQGILRSKIENEIGGWTVSKKVRSTKKYKSDKKEFLRLLTKDFLPNCTKRSEIIGLSRAYRNMTKGSPPDLFVFNVKKKIWFFTEVKSLNDNLSKTQWDWIGEFQKSIKDHFLLTKIVPTKDRLHVHLSNDYS